MSDLRKRFHALLAGDADLLAAWTVRCEPGWVLACVLATVLGCGLYGFAFGLWRSGLQGGFTAIKFPVVVLVTCGGNAVLNGSLALVLGSGLGFRSSSMAILMSFTITALLLAAFVPVMLFALWNTPGIHESNAIIGRSVTVLLNVCVIALAGVVGNWRLWQLLHRLSGLKSLANRVLFCWLWGNLLLGSQVSWILRPWVGDLDRPVAFFSPEPMRGNFFEAVWVLSSKLAAPAPNATPNTHPQQTK